MESVYSEGLVHRFGFNTEDRPDPFKPISFCMQGAENLDLFLDPSFGSTCTLGIFTDLCNFKKNWICSKVPLCNSYIPFELFYSPLSLIVFKWGYFSIWALSAYLPPSEFLENTWIQYENLHRNMNLFCNRTCCVVLTVFWQDRNMLFFKEMKEYQEEQKYQVQKPKQYTLKLNQK